ncbi:MAG: hypothetical protein ACI9W6_000048, partial [Motiliproteus sp.]
QVVYTAVATDTADSDDNSNTSGALIYSLAGTDAALFSIVGGAVTLTADPDHETKSSYSFTVVATDTDDNSSEQAVSLTINDLDDTAPTFTGGETATATPINENSGAGQLVYTPVATDTADLADDSDTTGFSYILKPETGDISAFSINETTGEVTLIGNPDYETKSIYSFTLVATDDTGNSREQEVSLSIEDLDDTPPTVTFTKAEDDVGSVRGFLTSGDATDDTLLLLTGTNESGASVIVYDGTTQLGVASVDGTAWSYEATVVDGTEHAFNVTATDAAGNTSNPTSDFVVTGDTQPPTVSSVAITIGINSRNNTLNVGDIVIVSVTMSEKVFVDTSGGSPELTLTIGNEEVQALYASGHDSKAVVFAYAITAGNTDTNGISIGSNALSLNGAILTDEIGNLAILTHDSVGDNAGYLVDTTPPIANLTAVNDDTGTVTTGATTDDNTLVITGSKEAGSTVTVFDGNSELGDATETGDGTTWSYSTEALTNGDHAFSVIESDAAGNASIPTDDFLVTVDAPVPVVVIFDLTAGTVKDGSNGSTFTEFFDDTVYEIYILVNASTRQKTDVSDVLGGANLDEDDRITMSAKVNGEAVIAQSLEVSKSQGLSSSAIIKWSSLNNPAVTLRADGQLFRFAPSGYGLSTVDLWTGSAPTGSQAVTSVRYNTYPATFSI